MRKALHLVVPLVLAMLLAAVFSAPSAARSLAPEAASDYDPIAELTLPDGATPSPSNDVRAVAAYGRYAHVLSRVGKLLTFDLSGLLASLPAPGDPIVTLGDPVASLDIPGFGSGILRNGTLAYVYGLNGIMVVKDVDTDGPAAGTTFSDRNTYNLIQHGGALIGVGPDHVTIYSLDNPENPVEQNNYGLNGNKGFAATVVQGQTLLVGHLGAGANGVDGISVFSYSYPSASFVQTYSTVTPYHLYAFGNYVVACNSNTLDLWNFTSPDDAGIRDTWQVGGRVCARDGDNLVANGTALNVGADGYFNWLNNFNPGGGQIDGFPHGSAVEGPLVFLAQSGRILILTRPVPLTSPATLTPPRLDGIISRGEWSLGDKVPFEEGFLVARNDGQRLYLLLDVLGDNSPDLNDAVNLSFDVNQDGEITPGTDVNYHMLPRTRNLRPRYYTSTETFGQDWTDYRSGRATGYGCSLVDGSLSFVLQQGIVCNRHVVYELAIDLEEIGAAPGEPVHMGVGVMSGDPQFVYEMPEGYLNEFSNLIVVELGDLTLPPPDTGPAVPFNGKPLEVTQAVQDLDNTLPLVADKDTTVRAYLNNSSGSSASLGVWLYGTRGAVDLPGSPLYVGFDAPTAVNRTQLDDTANFDLPDSWTQAGSVAFYARAKRWLGAQTTSSTVNVAFQTRQTPLVWTIPVNQGSASSPNLQPAGDRADARDYMKTVYPVPDITYVNKPWTALGANMPTSDALIAELNDYHGKVLLAWIFGFLFSGSSPFELPDQIHGFTPTSDGLSDPTWYNSGNGYVAYSGDIFDGDLIAAHEINHNLDRSSNGTWGRHNGGCGSTGPDPNWPYANDDVNEIGFDTRPPWVNGVVSDRRTVITTNYPDFMSYCTHVNMPGAWISPYRWNNLFNVFAPPAATSTEETAAHNPATARALASVNAIEEVMYLSGSLHDDGSGMLDPILVEQGMPAYPVAGSTYTIEVRDAGNSLLDSFSFDMSFTSLEDEPLTEVYFNFQIPNPVGTHAVLLKKGSTLLDQIVVSDNAPTVNVTEPNGGEVWSGTGSVAWQANDADGDDLLFSLLYSPDNGATWHPVASGLTGNSFEVDVSLLPGGSQGKIKVLATDGYNTTESDSAGTFTVPNQPPVAEITSFAPGDYFDSGAYIPLQANAYDPEGATLLDTDYVWTIDGDPAAIGADTGVFLDDGLHTVTLTVSDDASNETTVTSYVLVNTHLLELPLLFK